MISARKKKPLTHGEASDKVLHTFVSFFNSTLEAALALLNKRDRLALAAYLYNVADQLIAPSDRDDGR